MRTRNLAEVGLTGLEQLRDITKLLIRNGYPEYFYNDVVFWEFDTETERMYLMNDDDQICAINGDELELEYDCVVSEEVGFIDELISKVDDNIITHVDHIKYLMGICECLLDHDGVVICTKKLKYQKITHELYRTLIFGYDDIDEVMRKHDFILVDESEGEYHDMVYQYDYDDDIEFMISVRTDGSYDIVSIIDAVV